MDTTFIEAIYRLIQTPLQGVTDSLGGVIVMGFIIPFLWWFGVHGSTIVGELMGSVLTENSLANQAIIDAVELDSIDLLGYTPWECIDLMSARTGEMKKRYGFIYVDKDNDGHGTLKRSKKKSYDWYKKVITSNGEDLA